MQVCLVVTVCMAGDAYMAVGQVQQVAKPAAGAVPPLIADAVLQDDVVSAEGAQQAVHVLGRPLRIDLVNLQNGAGGTALSGQLVRRPQPRTDESELMGDMNSTQPGSNT